MNIPATLAVLALAAVSAGAAASAQTLPPSGRREMRSDCRRVQDAAGKIDTAVRDMFSANGVGLSYLNGALTVLRQDQALLQLANAQVYRNSQAVDPSTGRSTDCNAMLAAIDDARHVHDSVLKPAYEEALRHCSAGPVAVGENCFKAAELAYKRHRFVAEHDFTNFVNAERAAPRACLAGNAVFTLSADLRAEPCARRHGSSTLCGSLGRGLRDLDKNLHRARADDLEGLRDRNTKLAASGVVMILRKAGDGVHSLRANPSVPNDILYKSGALILAAKKAIVPVKSSACDEEPPVARPL